ncbi:hypothetical protein KVV02_004877 [Mortierella alpina]|uniref:Uncharacterized protein n=1 Tax=Mortierella alpina TaxID=64518 RepID=A0A9P8A9Z8_MORAP|nr:hypothetical protein KVV02_004877 [Mortierella alpina]
MGGATPIPTSIGINELVGLILVGASITLSLHSLIRMFFMRRTASKFHLFPIVNAMQFINQWSIFFLVTASINLISFRAGLWLNLVNNFCYFITKPAMMYLAYLRCSAVYPAFTKVDWLHYSLITLRAIELFGIVIVDAMQNYLCGGSTALGTKCERLAIAWTIQDAFAPVFRLYYIVCEAIFYVVLFRTLQGMAAGHENTGLIRYRRMQTTMFTVDLLLLTFMSIYRVMTIFINLPTYVYLEIFSSTLTIFNLTEFGLNIRVLFCAVADAKANSDACCPSKLEMGTIIAYSPKHSIGSMPLVGRGHPSRNAIGKFRPQTNVSTSPLTSFAIDAGYNSESDLTNSAAASTRHQSTTIQAVDDYPDFIPYSPPGSPSPQSTSNSIHWSPSSYSTPSSSSSPALRQESHIITPSSLQNQTQIGTHGLTEGVRISRPNRAHVSPEHSSTRRRADDRHF